VVRSDDWLITVDQPFRPWLAGPGVTDPSPIVAASPRVDDGMVFSATASGVVEARNAATGALCWRRDVGGPITTGVTVTAGMIYVGCKNGHVHVLDEHTGEPARQKPYVAGQAVSGAPVLVDGLACVAAEDGLYVFGGDGSWGKFAPGGVTTSVPGESNAWSVPVAAGHTVFVAAHGWLCMVDDITVRPLAGRKIATDVRCGQPCADQDEGAVYACFDDQTIRKFSATDGRQMYPAPQPAGRLTQLLDRGKSLGRRSLYSTAPVVAPGQDEVSRVYVGTRDGRLLAFRASDLQADGETRIGETEVTGLAVAGTTIYAGSADHTLYAVTGLVRRWRSNDLEAGISSPPTIAGGVAYVTTAAGRLIATGVPR
jgi:outer membrane protein assembly factor BamB